MVDVQGVWIHITEASPWRGGLYHVVTRPLRRETVVVIVFIHIGVGFEVAYLYDGASSMA